MRTKSFDGSQLRKVLIGMVLSEKVISRVSPHWSSAGLFDSYWANLVGRWCVDYYNQYNQPPKSSIQSVFENWAEENEDHADVRSVSTFLEFLSDESDSVDDGLLVDLAEKYINRIKLKKLVEQLNFEIERGTVEDGLKTVSSFTATKFDQPDFVEPGRDEVPWESAFSQERGEPLVKYPGACGEFFADSFRRGEFYSWMGPDKTGKTTYLLDFAYRALRQRNRVVFFDTGDSSQDDVMVRIAVRTERRPEYAGEVAVPVGWGGEGELLVEKRSLGAASASRGFSEFKKIIKDPDAFRLECHANGSLSVSDISAILTDWNREGWKPDVVVVDYADILAAPRGIVDPLRQIDETWMQLRRLSQEHDCLCVTATQSNAAAYGNEKGLLSRKNFSGRKTKLAHVNGMIGINVSDDERETHQTRLNWVVRRKMRNRSRRNFVVVAGCFDLECPIFQSRWP